MTTGLSIDGAGFEMLVGNERIGSRRLVGQDDVTLLTDLANRYVRAVQARSDSGAFITLGRELYGWLDGDEGQLTALLNQARSPIVFEVQGPRRPTEQAWAVLRAPFELLAEPTSGFLAEDALTRFCAVRRLGLLSKERPALDDCRLGLAFMASSPRGVHDLDYEAEEAAILTAVGETNIDLVVDDTGDPQQLARRLAALHGMPAVHLSCHGLNNWHDPKGGDPKPVLLMETDDGGPRPTTAADLAELLTTTPRLLFVSACLSATAANEDYLPAGNGHTAEPAKDAVVNVDADGPSARGRRPDLGDKDRRGTDVGWDLKGAANGSGPVTHSCSTAMAERCPSRCYARRPTPPSLAGTARKARRC
jgi:CHAT domain